MKYFLSLVLAVSLVACQRRPLQKDLLSDDSVVRTKAIEKLKKLSDEKKILILPALGEAFHNSDSQIAHRAQDAFVVIGSLAIPALQSALKDADVYVRICAAETLGKIGGAAQSALPELMLSLKDRHPLVREEAAIAVKKIKAG